MEGVEPTHASEVCNSNENYSEYIKWSRIQGGKDFADPVSLSNESKNGGMSFNRYIPWKKKKPHKIFKKQSRPHEVLMTLKKTSKSAKIYRSLCTQRRKITHEDDDVNNASLLLALFSERPKSS